MSSYTLSGTGVQSLSAGTTALHISITTLPTPAGSGRANPTAYYDVALLRFGDGTGFWAPFPVVGGPQWVGLPDGVTELGYSVFGAGVIDVVEVIGGARPFGATLLSQLSDVSIPTPAGGDVLTYDVATALWLAVAPSGGGGSGDVIVAEDQKASGTAGGGFTSGAWQTRTLNTLVTDTTGAASLASNQLTVPAGSYRVLAAAPGFAVNQHQLRLYNVTDAAVALLGSNAHAQNTGSIQTTARLAGRIVLAASKALRLEHRCQNTVGTNGFGLANSWGTEVYASLVLLKE